jgi:uncharacterized oxidoreductase
MTAFPLTGRVALVTGGGKGIGAELVRRLLDEGAARVLVVGRNEARLAAAVRRHGDRVTPLCADLSRPDAVDWLLTEVPRLAPDLSLLVNNAGSQILTDLPSGSEPAAIAAMRAELEVNLSAVVALSAGLLKLLGQQPSAALVNVTSGLALAPKQSAPVYCATKAAVRSFTMALRDQCRAPLPHVRIVEALPPLVATDMTRGRGRGKITAAACADAIVDGLLAGRQEILVGKARLLSAVMRVSPALGRRIMRGN